MNYEIPDNEVKNILSVYWQMLRELEGYTNPSTNKGNSQLVEAAYKVLRRAGIHDGHARWQIPEECDCGCTSFVWWVKEDGRFSSATPREYYNKDRHPQAKCYRCSKDVH